MNIKITHAIQGDLPFLDEPYLHLISIYENITGTVRFNPMLNAMKYSVNHQLAPLPL